MLMLLFQAGDNLYAIDSAQVVEVIPIVTLRSLNHVPDYIAGVFNYRGNLVPVVDLCRLLHHTDCRFRFSTRIMMVYYPTSEGTQRWLGLMAERVTETLNRPDLDAKNMTQVSDVPYLGNLFMDEKGMIQQIHWQHLVSDDRSASLFIQESAEANGARRD